MKFAFKVIHRSKLTSMRCPIHHTFKTHKLMKEYHQIFISLNISAKGQEKVKGVFTRQPKEDNQNETSSTWSYKS